MNRSFDILDFKDECYEVKLDDPLKVGDDLTPDDFDEKLNQLVAWLEPRSTGQYLILIKTVWFTYEADAIMFRLGYQYHG